MTKFLAKGNTCHTNTVAPNEVCGKRSKKKERKEKKKSRLKRNTSGGELF